MSAEEIKKPVINGTTVIAIIAIIGVAMLFILIHDLNTKITNLTEIVDSQNTILQYHEKLLMQHELILQQESNSTQKQAQFNVDVNEWAKTVEDRLGKK